MVGGSIANQNIHDGIVFFGRGTRIVMPESLRDQTPELAQEGHPGLTVMKQRLRAKVWWPKIDV